MAPPSITYFISPHYSLSRTSLLPYSLTPYTFSINSSPFVAVYKWSVSYPHTLPLIAVTMLPWQLFHYYFHRLYLTFVNHLFVHLYKFSLYDLYEIESVGQEDEIGVTRRKIRKGKWWNVYEEKSSRHNDNNKDLKKIIYEMPSWKNAKEMTNEIPVITEKT